MTAGAQASIHPTGIAQGLVFRWPGDAWYFPRRDEPARPRSAAAPQGWRSWSSTSAGGDQIWEAGMGFPRRHHTPAAQRLKFACRCSVAVLPGPAGGSLRRRHAASGSRFAPHYHVAAPPGSLCGWRNGSPDQVARLQRPHLSVSRWA